MITQVFMIDYFNQNFIIFYLPYMVNMINIWKKYNYYYFIIIILFFSGFVPHCIFIQTAEIYLVSFSRGQKRKGKNGKAIFGLLYIVDFDESYEGTPIRYNPWEKRVCLYKDLWYLYYLFIYRCIRDF